MPRRIIMTRKDPSSAIICIAAVVTKLLLLIVVVIQQPHLGDCLQMKRLILRNSNSHRHHHRSWWLQRSSQVAVPVVSTAGLITHHRNQNNNRGFLQTTTALFSSVKETAKETLEAASVVEDETEKKDSNDDDDEVDNEDSASSSSSSSSIGPPESVIFDITQQWDVTNQSSSADFFARLFPTTECEEGQKQPNSNDNTGKNQSFFGKFQDAVTDVIDDFVPNATNTNSKTEKDTEAPLTEFGTSLMGLLTGGGGGGSNSSSSSSSADTVEDMVAKARSMSEKGDVSDKASLMELIEITQQATAALDDQFDEFFDNDPTSTTKVPPPALYPSNIFYYLEYEEGVKNPSYKRRKHRFCSGVDMGEVETLNEKLRLALLSYGDSTEEIQSSLETQFNCELVYCAMDSYPGKPSHFIAVKKEQSSWSTAPLEMILVVRGTKTITDVITDLLCDDIEYRGGLAHAGILESGKYLAEKHDALFQNLLKLSGKKRIKLTLVGHSLGAGAATIAGMEMQDKAHLEVQVYGFGCPALVSEDLSEAASDYVTTVVCDNDLIPRMSTATMINAIMKVGSFNWVPYARRDLEEAAGEIQRRLPLLLTEGNMDRIMSMIDDILPAEPTIDPAHAEKRMEPVLFPPGKIYHFYQDGFGISGNVVPCTFFNELDLSRRMIHDHLLFAGYERIFLDMMREEHKDHYFQFEIDKTKQLVEEQQK